MDPRPKDILSEQEEAFALAYVANGKDRIAAYRSAGYPQGPETQDETCRVQGTRIIHRPHVARRINELVDQSVADSAKLFTASVALERFLSIATADPDELIGLRVGCCRHCYGADHQFQWKMHEYLAALETWEHLEPSIKLRTVAPDPAGGLEFNHTLPPIDTCPNCRGEGLERVVARDTSKLSPQARLLYGGVKAKKDGLEVIIASREKALENAARIVGAFKDGMHGGVGGAAAQAMAQAVAEEPTKDPIAAAKAYQELMASAGYRA